MSKLIAYSHFGGKDLYNGCPNIKGSVVKECLSLEDDNYYISVISLVKEDGVEFKLEIRQEK